MYSLYIGSLCNVYVAFPMARFTCIVTTQVFVEIWALPFVGAENIYEKSSAWMIIIKSPGLENQVLLRSIAIRNDRIWKHLMKYFNDFKFIFHRDLKLFTNAYSDFDALPIFIS